MEYLKQIIIYFSFMLNPNKDNYYLKKYNAVMGDLPSIIKEEKVRKYFDGEIEPHFPNLSEDIKTVLGIDENANGIRDDVEIWINRKFKNYNHRQALKAYIKIINTIMVMELRKQKKLHSELKKLYVEYQQASQCFFAVRKIDMSNHQQNTARTDLDNLYFNTVIRKKMYESYIDKILKTRDSKEDLQKIKRATDGNQILDSCAFKVENRNLIYENFPAYMKK